MTYMPYKIQHYSFPIMLEYRVLIPTRRVYYLPQQKAIFYYKSKQHITVFATMESTPTLCILLKQR